ncbi:unnamed protein product [Bursaphelenchus xylophilus]|uniref:(pine wood nematode) hypothetical protein n=1 Tax=Bursaphelenchus xylophilus TaxID=6326 RepID=A0A1I7SE19_BURXY|nr:unnamed protein product [Bursaphelenchus xylophilus]CAG9113167.1 unnamed protein product [Bursaphelenchus xylophilus]
MQDKPLRIRPDFDTDVLWKPPVARVRTISVDSNASEDSPNASSTGRRFSFTEMFTGPFHRKASLSESDGSTQRKSSITENVDFKEFMKRQKRILEEQ